MSPAEPPLPQIHLLPHAETLLPLLLRELKAPDAINRHNSAYAAGVLMEHCGAHMTAHLPGLLQVRS